MIKGNLHLSFYLSLGVIYELITLAAAAGSKDGPWWGGGVRLALGTAWDTPAQPTALLFQLCSSRPSKTEFSKQCRGSEKMGGEGRKGGAVLSQPFPPSSLPCPWSKQLCYPSFLPGLWRERGVFRQDLEGMDGLGREKMKSQQPKKEIPG